MNLTSPKYIRQVLSELDFTPGKSMGQNFLIDANILKLIMRNVELESGDRVIEVGPGLGVLTETLLSGAERVIAIEKDRKLHAFLERQFGARSNLELIHGDALKFDWSAFAGTGTVKFVSNLPYSVASRILVDLFIATVKMKRIVVMLQTDVADRIAAPPGSGDRGLLSILAQRFYRVAFVKEVGANCFIPRPKVGSAIVVCDLLDEPVARVADDPFFMRMVKMTFTHRRKMIPNALRGAGFAGDQIAFALDQAQIEGKLRPENLEVEQWAALSDALLRASIEGA